MEHQYCISLLFYAKMKIAFICLLNYFLLANAFNGGDRGLGNNFGNQGFDHNNFANNNFANNKPAQTGPTFAQFAKDFHAGFVSAPGPVNTALASGVVAGITKSELAGKMTATLGNIANGVAKGVPALGYAIGRANGLFANGPPSANGKASGIGNSGGGSGNLAGNGRAGNMSPNNGRSGK